MRGDPAKTSSQSPELGLSICRSDSIVWDVPALRSVGTPNFQVWGVAASTLGEEARGLLPSGGARQGSRSRTHVGGGLLPSDAPDRQHCLPSPASSPGCRCSGRKPAPLRWPLPHASRHQGGSQAPSPHWHMPQHSESHLFLPLRPQAPGCPLFCPCPSCSLHVAARGFSGAQTWACLSPAQNLSSQQAWGEEPWPLIGKQDLEGMGLNPHGLLPLFRFFVFFLRLYFHIISTHCA